MFLNLKNHEIIIIIVIFILIGIYLVNKKNQENMGSLSILSCTSIDPTTKILIQSSILSKYLNELNDHINDNSLYTALYLNDYRNYNNNNNNNNNITVRGQSVFVRIPTINLQFDNTRKKFMLTFNRPTLGDTFNERNTPAVDLYIKNRGDFYKKFYFAFSNNKYYLVRKYFLNTHDSGNYRITDIQTDDKICDFTDNIKKISTFLDANSNNINEITGYNIVFNSSKTLNTNPLETTICTKLKNKIISTLNVNFAPLKTQLLSNINKLENNIFNYYAYLFIKMLDRNISLSVDSKTENDNVYNYKLSFDGGIGYDNIFYSSKPITTLFGVTGIRYDKNQGNFVDTLGKNMGGKSDLNGSGWSKTIENLKNTKYYYFGKFNNKIYFYRDVDFDEGKNDWGKNVAVTYMDITTDIKNITNMINDFANKLIGTNNLRYIAYPIRENNTSKILFYPDPDYISPPVPN